MITWIDKRLYSDVTVIIPTFNEGRSISDLLSLIVSLYPGVHCLVADDGSTDGTSEVVLNFNKVNANIILLDRYREPVKGLTASAMEGILRCKTPYFVVMDGDGQHPPEYIRECVANLVMGSDFCLGTRAPFAKKWRFTRIFISAVSTALARLRLLFNSVTVEDPMSGFFGAKTDFVKNILIKNESRIEPRGYKIAFDILKCLPDNSRLSGFYFHFGLREYDVSKFSPRLIYFFLRSLFR